MYIDYVFTHIVIEIIFIFNYRTEIRQHAALYGILYSICVDY